MGRSQQNGDFSVLKALKHRRENADHREPEELGNILQIRYGRKVTENAAKIKKKE